MYDGIALVVRHHCYLASLCMCEMVIACMGRRIVVWCCRFHHIRLVTLTAGTISSGSGQRRDA